MGHKYSVGELVHVINSHSFNPTPMVHEIIRLLPEDAGEFGYRLKSTLNGHERSVSESAIQASKAGQDVPKVGKADHKLPKVAGGTIQKKLFGWWVLTIVLAALGGAGLMSAYRGSSNDAGFFTFLGLIFGLTALAIYLHKLRPWQVYLSNRAHAEGLSGGSFTE